MIERGTVYSPRTRLLPAGWPVLALFVLYPLWWLLGLAGFVWFFLAVPMLLWLYWQETVRVPAIFGIWLLFLLWMAASLVTIDEPTRMMVAIHRASLYASASILFVYVYNASAAVVRRVVVAFAWFWAGIVLIGLLAIILPSVEIISPAERLLPGALLRSNYILDMTHVRLAQIHDFLGFPVGRPTGPFPSTNMWGSCFALSVPFVIAAMSVRPRPWRWLGPLLGFLGIIPLVVSLDRGAWLSLVLAGAYVVFRLAMRAQLGNLTRMLLVVSMAGFVILLTPLGGLIQERIEVGHSNEGRLDIYGQVIDEVSTRPLFGFGGPREAEGRYLPQLGTHGVFWLVLYSHGIPGALLFIGFFMAVLWRSRRVRTPIAFAAHVVIIVGLIQMPYYGLLPVGIHILMAAAALSLRTEASFDEGGGVSRDWIARSATRTNPI
jgi:hypothetical protein